MRDRNSEALTARQKKHKWNRTEQIGAIRFIARGLNLVLRLVVCPRQQDGLCEVVDNLREKRGVDRADAASCNFDVDRMWHVEVGGNDDRT